MKVCQKSVAERLIIPTIIMSIVIVVSNIVVQYPVHWLGLEDVLTYSSIIYPIVFLTNDIVNRVYGPKDAARVVVVSFVIGFICTLFIAPPRIAIGSLVAYLLGQLLDIAVFTPLRKKSWWVAPLTASIFGTAFDSLAFFSVAFAPCFRFINHLVGSVDSSIHGNVDFSGVNIPIWLSLAIGSLGVKLVLSSLMVLPYGVIMRTFFNNLFKKQRV